MHCTRRRRRRSNKDAPARPGVSRIPPHRGGAPAGPLGKHPAGCTAPAADAGVVIRTPRRDAFRLSQHRDRLLHRRTPASGEGGSGKHEAGGPQELPPPRFGCFTERSIGKLDRRPRVKGVAPFVLFEAFPVLLVVGTHGGSSSVVRGGTVDRSVNLLPCHAVPGGP